MLTVCKNLEASSLKVAFLSWLYRLLTIRSWPVLSKPFVEEVLRATDWSKSLTSMLAFDRHLQPFGTGTVTSVLQVAELRHREVKLLTCCHIARDNDFQCFPHFWPRVWNPKTYLLLCPCFFVSSLLYQLVSPVNRVPPYVKAKCYLLFKKLT